MQNQVFNNTTAAAPVAMVPELLTHDGVLLTQPTDAVWFQSDRDLPFSSDLACFHYYVSELPVNELNGDDGAIDVTTLAEWQAMQGVA